MCVRASVSTYRQIGQPSFTCQKANTLSMRGDENGGEYPQPLILAGRLSMLMKNVICF